MRARTFRGFGESGEVDTEGSGLPTDFSPDASSGEFDPSTVFEDPGYNLPTTPLPDPRATSFSRFVTNIVSRDAAAWAAAVTGRSSAGAPRSSAGAPAATLSTWAAQNKPMIYAAALALFLLALAGAGGRKR